MLKAAKSGVLLKNIDPGLIKGRDVRYPSHERAPQLNAFHALAVKARDELDVGVIAQEFTHLQSAMEKSLAYARESLKQAETPRSDDLE